MARSRRAMLWLLEPVKYCSAAPALAGGNQPQIRLKAAPKQDARLGFAVGQHALDHPVAGERVHQRRRRTGGEDIEVATGLAAAPEAPHRGDEGAGRRFTEPADERRGGIVGFGAEAAARDAGALLERLQDLAFLFRAHALELAQTPVARRGFELVERANPEVVIEQCHRLRSDALQMQQVEDGRRELLKQFLVIRNGAGIDKFADLGGEILADPRQREPFGRGRARRSIGMMRDVLRGVAIRANLERVLVLDFEEIANLGEDPRDGEIVHAGGSGYGQHYRLYNASMSIRDAVRHAGQLAIAGFAGHSIPSDLRALAKEFDLGGIILFARNVESPEQVAEIAREAQTLARELPLWVSVDQEGGRVARLQSPFTLWPPMQTLGRSGDETLAERFARSLAAELRAGRRDARLYAGARHSHQSEESRDRRSGIGRDAGRRREARDGHHQDPAGAGIAACGKHFPGHGDTSVDSHHEMPLVEHPPDRLEAVELVPFKAAIAAGVAGIMTAHVLVPALDEERPGTLSPAIVTGLLKEKLGFEGVVFTDDIGMKAISALYGTPEATLAAIAAGCDVVLMCGDSQEPQFAAMETLVHALEDGTLPLRRAEDALKRHRRMKERFLAPPRPPPLDGTALRTLLGRDEHQAVAAEMARFAS